jgi:purine nucleosidase
MQKRKIIIDTDPGQDDAVAILLALASPQEIDLLGITAVAGNVPLDLTKKNARIVCELAKITDVKGLCRLRKSYEKTACYSRACSRKNWFRWADLTQP